MLLPIIVGGFVMISSKSHISANLVRGILDSFTGSFVRIRDFPSDSEAFHANK
jgi:hypothetical protein